MATPAAAKPRDHLRVGRLSLHPCPGDQPGWCGALPRALDPAHPAGPRIDIGFNWIPAARRGRSHGTIVAVEGGPGFPSSGSVVEYTRTFGPLLRDHDLLLVDLRGTGASALIDCRPLQTFPRRTSGSAFARVVAGCGRTLNRRFRYRGGRRVHAADLFATAYATGDLAAVLAALGLDDVDLYGDS
jgi:pimeloyl-ACP methyl ester carboxylesterase